MDEAYVLETAGKYWAWERIKGVYSISNALTIESDWDLSSKNLVEHAVEMRLCKSKEDFNFAKCYSDRFYTYFAHGRERRACTLRELKELTLLVGTITNYPSFVKEEVAYSARIARY